MRAYSSSTYSTACYRENASQRKTYIYTLQDVSDAKRLNSHDQKVWIGYVSLTLLASIVPSLYNVHDHIHIIIKNLNSIYNTHLYVY